MITGKHLIAGHWVTSERTFSSTPVTGPGAEFATATGEQIDQVCQAAEAAFPSYGDSPRPQRAAFLESIAEEIERRGRELTEIGVKETGLPEARLEGERGRTTGQLRLFASHIVQGEYLDKRHDAALPDRQPLPRPELYMVQRPIGPVAVFGASNFPLAFSTAGGDTAAALAAGCPVVVRGHPAHPGTGELVAQAVDAARKSQGLDPGVFGFVQGDTLEIGAALVQHPRIKAVGFTGSLAGGRALFDLCAARPEPIPFFGELGSINPVFVLPGALGARAADIAQGWAQSVTMGVGQFCTNPGVVVVLQGSEADAFAAAAGDALAPVAEQMMLTDGIAAAYRRGRDHVRESADELLASPCSGRGAAPALFRTSATRFMDRAALAEEVFGPLGIVVVASSIDEMVAVAAHLQGQLTCTLQLEQEDLALARRLLPVLERKAGRILANGFPTGVEVADAMVHGGPYPASTNFGATSVGTLSIRRFLRPVCYQNLPESLLPVDAAGILTPGESYAQPEPMDAAMERLRDGPLRGRQDP